MMSRQTHSCQRHLSLALLQGQRGNQSHLHQTEWSHFLAVAALVTADQRCFDQTRKVSVQNLSQMKTSARTKRCLCLLQQLLGPSGQMEKCLLQLTLLLSGQSQIHLFGQNLVSPLADQKERLLLLVPVQRLIVQPKTVQTWGQQMPLASRTMMW